MKIEQMLFKVVREAIDTLPDYDAAGLDDDQVCDVAWVKTRLADALVIAEADSQAQTVQQKAA